MPSFGKIRCRWPPTVRGDRNSRCPISLLLRPAAASIAICRSCGVSETRSRSPARGLARPVARSSLAARSAHERAPRCSNVSSAATRGTREPGEPPCVPGVRLHGRGPPWCCPLDHLVGQCPRRVIVTPSGSQESLNVAPHPRQEAVAVGFAQLDAFVGELLGLVPLAGPEAVAAQHHERIDARRDRAAFTTLPAYPPHGLPAARQPPESHA